MSKNISKKGMKESAKENHRKGGTAEEGRLERLQNESFLKCTLTIHTTRKDPEGFLTDIAAGVVD